MVEATKLFKQTSVAVSNESCPKGGVTRLPGHISWSTWIHVSRNYSPGENWKLIMVNINAWGVQFSWELVR